MLPTWIFLVCVVAAWWARRDAGRMLAVFMVSSVFGASAALEVLMLSGAPVTPTLFFVPILALVALRMQGLRHFLAGVSLRQPGGWLLVFVLWGVFAAVFMPRLLQGETMVFTTVRDAIAGTEIQRVLLAPNSTNATQSIYLLTGLIAFAVVRAMATSASLHRWVLSGLYATAIVNAAFAALDLTSALTGTELGLALVRNANYAIVAQSVGGWPRLQGAFSEPSALASFTTVPFAALAALWLRGIEPGRTGLLAVISGFVLLGTLSSTAFVSIAVLLVMLALAQLLQSLASNRLRMRFGMASCALLVAVVVACGLILWWPTWLQRFVDIAWAMVFQKADSDSGIERLSWAMGTWENFVDSYGLGTGAGSARGSSWPLVVLGNTGVPGAVAMLICLGLCLFAPGRGLSAQTRALLFACRMALLARLIPMTLSGTMIDPGIQVFIMIGLIAGLLDSAETAGSRAAPAASRARRHLAPVRS